ncbi:MAG: hypothetical protein KatS3mg019_1855 [Fimbriimonadales bacterium]|nr:MAG: hypothetical protein KatS3mg019_1855 [Fimbriimonadales bacterium]
MEPIWWSGALALSVWGAVGLWRGVRASGVRVGWLRDWGGWIIASSVGSLATAVLPHAPPLAQALLLLGASAGLLRLAYALDSPAIGHGVVGGLGLIALFLDSLSGGVWARDGILGHGSDMTQVGEPYGMLALLWCLIVSRAWLQIEGKPFVVAYLASGVALWLAWKGGSAALGWGATLSALMLSLMLLQREHQERRRLRLAMQGRPMRVVRPPQGYDLALHGALLLGLCLASLWLCGLPPAPFSALHAPRLVPLAVGGVSLLGVLRCRARRPLPIALQRAWLVATLATALLSTEPLTLLALSVWFYWGFLGANLQEIPMRAANLSIRIGGRE